MSFFRVLERKEDATRKGIHPGRLTWNLRMHPGKRKIIFQTIIFRFYVNVYKRGAFKCSLRLLRSSVSATKESTPVRTMVKPSHWQKKA